ncbi:hypothetical protein BC835DRAFT_591219 [Cytidiella melzeri]|nr:hypothetical protein BC835DRAFT_591219 [Cytidiella melzeri]
MDTTNGLTRQLSPLPLAIAAPQPKYAVTLHSNAYKVASPVWLASPGLASAMPLTSPGSKADVIPFNTPLTSADVEQRLAHSSRARQIYGLLRKTASTSRGLTPYTGYFREETFHCIVNGFWRGPDDLDGHSAELSARKFAEFGCRTRPDTYQLLPIGSDLASKCRDAMQRKQMGWAQHLNYDGSLQYLQPGVPVSVALDFQHDFLFDFLVFDDARGYCGLYRNILPCPAEGDPLDKMHFGLAEDSGVPVLKTAQGAWTVNDGHRPAFTDGEDLIMTLHLVWPGYHPSYPKLRLSHTYTRQEVAQAISREILVWAALLAQTTPASGCQLWDLQNLALLDSLWLAGARRYAGDFWALDLHLSQQLAGSDAEFRSW